MNVMNVSEKMYGFTVTGITPLGGARAVEMEHEKTGAKLIFMDNSDDNKLFSIAFKTLPEDDTGVFHILEHSVLCGSDKYPVKEPFLDLLKSSMNTFLNAMTFPDKTVYPVSSMNDRDFLNLTKVYLDAVFAPAIYHNPCIFEQEGWHIELDGEPAFNGVVFNEMKGALSSVHRRIDRELEKQLFPESCYRFESGGDPEAIPSLTYEQFLATHKRFYHPSNAYVYLDGNVNLDEVLPLLDEYFSKYAKRENDFELTGQVLVKPCESKAYYEISEDEPLENKSYFAFGKLLGKYDDVKKVFACHALAKVLTGSNESPLSRALLDSGLCAEVDVSVNDGIYQPYFSLTVENTEEESVKEIKRIIKETVERLISGELDRENLLATIDRMQFEILEGEEPQGLERNVYILSSWLYGGNPYLYIEIDKTFESLREAVQTDYYEELLKELFLDEDGRASTLVLPSRTYGREQAEAEKLRLQSFMKTWTEADRKSAVEENAKLRNWQETSDSEEAAATLPKLPLSEVSDVPKLYPTDISDEDGVKILRRKPKTSGITCLNLYFSAADCSADELFLLEIMSGVMKNLPTKKFDTLTLQKKIREIFGGLAFSVDAFGNVNDFNTSKPFFTVKAKMLGKNYENAVELIPEILLGTVFDDGGKVKELLAQRIERFRRLLMANGHLFALMRSRASLSSESAVRELTSGYESHKRVTELNENFNNEELKSKFEDLCSKIFCRSRLTVSLTSENAEEVGNLLNAFPKGNAPQSDKCVFKMKLDDVEKISVPSGVSYCSSSVKSKIEDTALWKVTANIISLQYLWNEIRVKGGAYGAGANLSSVGEFSYYTYRDPSPMSSLGVFKSCAGFIEDYCKASPDVESFIISAIAKEESLKTDADAASYADGLFFEGKTDEMRIAERRRMLSLSSSDLIACVKELENTGFSCVIANADALCLTHS